MLHPRLLPRTSGIPSALAALLLATGPWSLERAGASTSAASGTQIQATFRADRIYVTLKVQPAHSDLTFYTDSGGSLVITERAALKAKLDIVPATDPELLQAMGGTARVTSAPEFANGPRLPPGSQLLVLKDMVQIPGWPTQGDGILGQAWLGAHVWTWDYPERKLILRPDGWEPGTAAHPLEVAFRTSADGQRENNFPRITIRIDGEDIPVLFDTGAETYLTRDAVRALNDRGPRLRATTMIMHSLFERWHAGHPDWPVIADAQVGTHARMIRVPRVGIGGFETGPVWITERSDASFTKFMSSMMSAPVSGSAGGNIFHPFRVTLDYTRSMMWIESP